MLPLGATITSLCRTTVPAFRSPVVGHRSTRGDVANSTFSFPELAGATRLKTMQSLRVATITRGISRLPRRRRRGLRVIDTADFKAWSNPKRLSANMKVSRCVSNNRAY